ncbi:MAG: hypothetical protein K2K52_03855 [Paramuribaculum sp.]|nr:hypothetical protein [Paramuribaculum sp.]
MKKILLTCGAAIAAIMLPACSSDDTTKNNQLTPIELSRAEIEVSADINDFSINILKAIVDQNFEDRNIAVSPLGATMVAGMFGNAIADEDLTELTKALGLEGNDLTALNSFNSTMLSTLPSHDKSAILKIANASWFDQNHVQVSDLYRTVLQDTYKSEIRLADFNNSATLTDINAWVSDRTDKAIPKILDKIEEGDRAVWLNALYFKGIWKSRFDKSKTKKENFILENGKTTEVDMMREAKEVAGKLYRTPVEGFTGSLYGPDADTKNIFTTTMATLDYGNGAFALTAIMPDARIKIKDFIAENHDKLIAAIAGEDVFGKNWNPATDVVFPRLNLSIDTDLVNPMIALGAKNIFTGVDMPGIGYNANKSMIVSKFKQNIILDLDEEGTKVKVATAGKGSDLMSNLPETAKFDHPFIYFIWEKTTGTILLEGVVMNPNEK